MLGRLILILIQLAAGWFLASHILRMLPNVGIEGRILLLAVVFAIVVWAIGALGAIVLKGVASPSPSTLVFALVGALLFALIPLVPDVAKAVKSVVSGIRPEIFPLIGAVIGYAIKR